MAGNIWLKKPHLPFRNSAHNEPRIVLMRGFFDAESFQWKSDGFGPSGRALSAKPTIFF
jgi:hypothetical protein